MWKSARMRNTLDEGKTIIGSNMGEAAFNMQELHGILGKRNATESDYNQWAENIASNLEAIANQLKSTCESIYNIANDNRKLDYMSKHFLDVKLRAYLEEVTTFVQNLDAKLSDASLGNGIPLHFDISKCDATNMNNALAHLKEVIMKCQEAFNFESNENQPEDK